ncbi:hypothetical protein [Antarcticimicrobium luteum]|uniref:Lipoprotein n=1 Tax=Antarcticimicrobium luteum TaxID=2547397 RepID=A0A4R5UWU8_9RHOB|nr:hypothetical protein [Antarcticimicrobium luteum]TDK43752.1 hypothetical protein E1832_15860 [Antarcticimicrobium luteum]
MLRFFCLCAVLLAVAGCATKQPFADGETIAAVSYRNPGPPTLALYTMVSNRTGKGGHTSLMINASERVIFDPAGSFYSEVVPERNDVLFGITPGVELAYRGAHARSTYHVVIQTVEVTAEQAEIAYRLALSNGAVPGVYCTNATSSLLKKVPGFEKIDITFYPTRLQQQFGRIPGVRTEEYFENDSPDLDKGLAEGNARLVALRQQEASASE